MKLRASEYVEKADSLKSSEMSVRQRLDSIRANRSVIRNEIETMRYQKRALYARLSAAMSANSGSDSQGGSDNSAQINSIRAEIAAVECRMDAAQEEDSILRAEEEEAAFELAEIEAEEQATLSEILDSADRTKQDTAIMSSYDGKFNDVKDRATASFLHNLGQLSQAAQILGGNVAMSSVGSGGGSCAGKLSRSAAAQTGGATRNLYEAANAQRKTAAVSGVFGARGAGTAFGGQKNKGFISDDTVFEKKPAKKGGGFGKRDPISRRGRNDSPPASDTVKDFSGFTAVKRADQNDCWDIRGNGFAAYDSYLSNPDSYDRTTYDTPQYGTAATDHIEGISKLRTVDIENPELFWGRDSGKSMEDFVLIAKKIPRVAKELKSGRTLGDLLMDKELGDCASIYFANAPQVYKGDGFYEYVDGGRHRILAAAASGQKIPVVIIGDIHKKQQSGFGRRTNDFLQQLKVDPSTLTTPKPSDTNTDHWPIEPREQERQYRAGGLGKRVSAPNATPAEALSDYMAQKHYTKENYVMCLKDPYWRYLYRAANPSGKLPPLSQKDAADLLEQYMTSHHYEEKDFAIYARDPVWQELQRYISPSHMPSFVRPDTKTASSGYNGMVQALASRNVEYRPFEPYGRQRADEEIIAKLSGGDETLGSCSSLAFAYAGNLAGYDVVDFRDGESRKLFSTDEMIKEIAYLPDVDSIVRFGTDEIECTNKLLKKMEPGKTYYLATGQHAAAVRNVDGQYEYLELQNRTPSKNKWYKLNTKVLEERFRCERDNDFECQNVLICFDSLQKSPEFLDLLGYLNTAETAQRKGMQGRAR